MAVFRVEKNSGYTVMSNHHLRNQELSLKAKGLLSQMLSLPDNWDYTLKGLSLINREKIDAIREAIRELERAGYIVRSRERDVKGRLRGADYVIYEFPQKPVSDLPTLENPTFSSQSMPVPLRSQGHAAQCSSFCLHSFTVLSVSNKGLRLSQQAMNRQGHFRECGYTPYACCGISFLTTTVDTLRFSKPDEKSISPLWQIVRTIIIAFIRVPVYNKQQRRTDRKWNICLARKPQRNGGSLIGAYKSYVRKIASPGFLALEICG